MARRERTTALPRRREREHAAHGGRRFLGMDWDLRHTQLTILGLAGALLVFVFGLAAWGWYSDRYVRPNETILTVGGQEVSLRYYSDRLLPWFQQNASTSLSPSLLEQSLLVKLEDEELTLLIAEDRGITITDEDVTNAIAADLGVPAGGDGSAYDSLYRDRLKATGMSDGNYRRLSRAQVANDRVMEQLTTALGETGEFVTLRTVVLDSEEKATAIRARIAAGEDMGTIAQTESLDLTSRQIDGLMVPDPPALLPDSIRTAIDGKGEGEIFDPVQVEDNWWVFKIEKREPASPYSDTNKQQLAGLEFDRILREKRLATTIERDLSADDIRWAEENS
ncbi:MAG: peptidylprolyl isomerase [Dehalococcoidia bacterium]